MVGAEAAPQVSTAGPAGTLPVHPTTNRKEKHMGRKKKDSSAKLTSLGDFLLDNNAAAYKEAYEAGFLDGMKGAPDNRVYADQKAEQSLRGRL